MVKIDTILERLYNKLAIKNDADFCKRYDIKPNTLSNWRARNSVPYDKILEIIKNEKISFDYIFLGKDTLKSQNVKQDGYYITSLTHSASAGTSSDVESVGVYDTNNKIFVSSTFFRYPIDENQVRIVQVVGDSMLPKLHSGDWVIIDIVDKTLGDGLYVVNYNSILMVKMLQFKPNGTIRIKSINPEYESYEVTEDTQEVFYIVGRVIKTIS